MSGSRNRELLDTQKKVWKQQLSRLKKRHQQKTALLEEHASRPHLAPPAPSAQFTAPRSPPPEDNLLEQEIRKATIFVNVASYRDPECPRTVADCFAKARHPGRVFVGICQQNEPEDVDCLAFEGVKKRRRNMRVMRLQADEAKGPVYARALIEQNLFRDEDYYLIVDSHTLFSPAWDVNCIHQLLLCDSKKPVLTCYPPEFDITSRALPAAQLPVFLKFRGFHERLGFSEQDPARFHQHPPKPLPSLFWAGGFSFSIGEMVRDVPFDINLQYVFLGEEISMAARLFTAGYDTFAPAVNLVFHYTPRKLATGAPRPVFWEQFYVRNGKCKVTSDLREQRKALEVTSNQRLRSLLAGEQINPPIYGLGTARSLRDFEEFIGLDFAEQTSKKRARLGLSKDANSEERFYKHGLLS